MKTSYKIRYSSFLPGKASLLFENEKLFDFFFKWLIKFSNFSLNTTKWYFYNWNFLNQTSISSKEHLLTFGLFLGVAQEESVRGRCWWSRPPWMGASRRRRGRSHSAGRERRTRPGHPHSLSESQESIILNIFHCIEGCVL